MTTTSTLPVARLRHTPTRRRLRTVAFTGVALLTFVGLTGVSEAASNSWEGRAPYSTPCTQNAKRIGAYRAWGAWSEVAAYIELWHSYNCGTAWVSVAIPHSAYNGTQTYIWNPGKPAQSVRPTSGYGYRASPMVDDRPGVETCVGTHVYRNGAYFNWQMQVCYR